MADGPTESGNQVSPLKTWDLLTLQLLRSDSQVSLEKRLSTLKSIFEMEKTLAGDWGVTSERRSSNSNLETSSSTGPGSVDGLATTRRKSSKQT